MRHREVFDPVRPSFSGAMLFPNTLRCFKVLDISDIQSVSGSLEQRLYLGSDGGDFCHYPSLRVSAKSHVDLDTIVSRINFVSDQEAIAFQHLKMNKKSQGLAAKEQAGRARDELREQFGVTLPEREWRTDLKGKMVFDARQMEMF